MRDHSQENRTGESIAFVSQLGCAEPISYLDRGIFIDLLHKHLEMNSY